jgi:hypothetical protein
MSGSRDGRSARRPRHRSAASREAERAPAESAWASRDGDARAPHTGSVSTRTPSISISTVEWPSQVARNPLAGGLTQFASGLSEGRGLCGTRRSPPQRNSLTVGIEARGSRKPGITGWMLRNRSPAHRGDALMRSSRALRVLCPEISWHEMHGYAGHWLGSITPVESWANSKNRFRDSFHPCRVTPGR